MDDTNTLVGHLGRETTGCRQPGDNCCLTSDTEKVKEIGL